MKIEIQLQKQLETIGLKDKEIAIYIAAFQIGVSSLQSLTQKTGFKRSTVYNYVESLKKKGLLKETQKGKKRIFVPAPPEKIEQLVDMKQWELEYLKKEMPDIVSYLSTFILKNKTNEVDESKTKVSYYDGDEALQSIAEDVFASDIIYYYSKMGPDFTKFPSNIEYFRSILTSKNVNHKAIIDDCTSNMSFEETNLYQIMHDVPNFHYRKVSSNYTIGLSELAVCIYSNKVIISLQKNQPEYIIIDNAHLNKMLINMYECLWNLLPKVDDKQIVS